MASTPRGETTSYEDLVRQEFETTWNEGRIDGSLYTDDFVYHGLLGSEPMDLEAYEETVSAFHAGIPDIRKEIADLVCDDDTVALRFGMSGTHDGELLGVPATGNDVSGTGMVFYRLDDGRIADAWINYDALGILQAIGAVPELDA